jgi:hypothetical protein
MTRSKMLGAVVLLALGAYAGAQENPGQMGAQPQPSATDPAKEAPQTPAPQPGPQQQQNVPPPGQQQNPPTTPTEPQARPSSGTGTSVDKPESEVGGTANPRPTPAGLPPAEANPSAGALQLVQPDAAQLRARIENALRREPSLSNTTIMLNISDDTIDITGNANTPKERLTARRIVQSFAGNRRVRERIAVAGIAPRETQAKDELGTPQGPGTKAKPAERPKEQVSQKEAKEKGDASGRPR